MKHIIHSMGLMINFFSFLLLLVVSFSLIYNGVDGQKMDSKQDDMDLESQLEGLREFSIKTVKNAVGDTYDCVDIKRQPSLIHPSLQNHEIQMRPTSLPRKLIKTTSREAGNVHALTVDCPEGTVPIRRIGREGLRRAKSFTESYLHNFHTMTQSSPGEHYAILRSKSNLNRLIIGLQGVASVHQIGNYVGTDQSSSAHMWLERATDSIQAGWIVSPDLYGDTRTRLFIFWKTKDGGCFNLLCSPGFVQLSSSLPVDLVLNQTIGQKLEIKLQIYKDLKTHNWWFELSDGSLVGYWPAGLLPELGNSASYGGNYYAWGGLAKGLPNGPSPLLGNGNVGAFDHDKAAYFRQLKIADSSEQWLNPREAELERYVDSDKCYGLIYHGYIKGAMGHNILYGGTGGGNCGV